MPRAPSIIDLARRDHLTTSHSLIADSKLAELAREDKLNMEVAGSYPLLHLAITNKNVDLVRKLLNMNGINVNQEINVSAPGRNPRFLAPIQLAAQLAVAPGHATQKKIDIISMLEDEGATAEWENSVGQRVRDGVASLRGAVPLPVAEEVMEPSAAHAPFAAAAARAPAVAAPALNKLRRMSSSISSDGEGRRSRRKRKRKRKKRTHRHRSKRRNKRKSRKYH